MPTGQYIHLSHICKLQLIDVKVHKLFLIINWVIIIDLLLFKKKHLVVSASI